jgi:TolB-like protein
MPAEPSAATIAARPVIAVLPLVDQSDDTAHAYFADGLTQDIINALGRFSALTVMSWNAVFPYKGEPASPEDIRRGLAVGYLVEGSVRRNGDQVRVVAQLVDTAKGQVVWSGRFDEALADVFALQDRITGEVVRALAIRVSEIEQRRVFAKPTENLEAYDYVLRARPALQRPTRANIVEARSLLRRAIELDPNYAAAYAALAETYYTTTSMGWSESPSESLGRAEELALDALSLDSAEVRARIVLSRIDILHQNYSQAKAEIDRAIAVNPNDAQSLAGRGNVLMWLGETDAAIEALEQALRIDPDLSAIDRFALSLAYYLKGRYDAAIEQAELNLRDTADADFSQVILAAAYAKADRAGDAARAAAAVRRLDPTFDPEEFGTKFLNAADLERVREGLRAAGFYPPAPR